MDELYIDAPISKTRELYTQYIKDLDHTTLEKDEMLNLIKALKRYELYDMVLKFALYSVELKFQGDAGVARSLLPIITSCYRNASNAQRAIYFFEEYQTIFGKQIISLHY